MQRCYNEKIEVTISQFPIIYWIKALEVALPDYIGASDLASKVSD